IRCMDTLTHLVRQSFGQRRKILRNNLKDVISLEEFDDLGINPQDRPEHLSVETYIELGNYLSQQRGRA
ncbi:MAG TPA: 16S rRNA (adenine(1518)-N(6)/adenine(1519)-N(6))-dimethyltransferase, partial [Gammaproteobacteria bacterium]|nr:16S rRNA (adenine(1518)-N(6)/adenine(1519)-N(6))-dimethyltransferase [Gammaproteobacteria bacterium]